jgi:hypothetical protein
MVVSNNESATTKNAGKLLVILIAMPMRQYDAGGAPGLHSEPLDAAIGQVPAPYHPGGRHDRRIC